MKWDLLKLIVNNDGCLCTRPSAGEQNILGVSVPPMASPLTVLWTLRPKMSIKQPWLQHRANSFPPNNHKTGSKLTLNGSKLKVFFID